MALSCSSLVSLYDSILASIFSEWISDADLCCLDSALCNYNLRIKFLSTLNKCSIINTDIERLDDSDKQWMQLRGLKLKRVLLDRISSKHLTILHPTHLSCVETGDCSKLASLLTPTLVIDELRVLVSTIRPELRQVGHLVTHMSLDDTCSDFSEHPTVFPSLKSVRCGYVSECREAILPLVDSCQLDTIDNCDMKYLMTRQSSFPMFLCDLKRVTNQDESAVRLGEGKYYQVITLKCSEDIYDDFSFILPLLPHVTKLFLKENLELAHSIASTCKNLTTLWVSSVDTMENDIMTIIEANVHLENIRLKSDERLEADELVSAIVTHCPNLLLCALTNIALNMESTSALFRQCTKLNYFSCEEWNTKTIVDYAKNITSLTVRKQQIGIVEKKGRCGSQLQMSCHFNEKTLQGIIQQNQLCNLRLEKVKLSGEDFDSMILACPYLTSLTMQQCNVVGSHLTDSCWNALVSNKTLMYIDVEEIKTFNEGLLLRLFECKKMLQRVSLSLPECQYTNAVLCQIASTCPDLKRLSISHNSAIFSDGIIEVLEKCRSLYHLELTRCPKVNSDILPSIQSPPLRAVKLIYCDVAQDKESLFSGTEKTLNIDIMF